MPSEHIALASQVGGHPGILTDQAGKTIIKPLLPVELAFYERLADRADGRLSALRGLTPSFEGVLELPAGGPGELGSSQGAASGAVVEDAGETAGCVLATDTAAAAGGGGADPPLPTKVRPPPSLIAPSLPG